MFVMSRCHPWLTGYLLIYSRFLILLEKTLSLKYNGILNCQFNYVDTDKR